MNQDLTALTAAGTAVAVAVTVMARTLRPSGQHRAPRAMVRPVEALDQTEAHCPVEHRTTLHVRFATGGAMCLACRHQTTTGGNT